MATNSKTWIFFVFFFLQICNDIGYLCSFTNKRTIHVISTKCKNMPDHFSSFAQLQTIIDFVLVKTILKVYYT